MVVTFSVASFFGAKSLIGSAGRTRLQIVPGDPPGWDHYRAGLSAPAYRSSVSLPCSASFKRIFTVEVLPGILDAGLVTVSEGSMRSSITVAVSLVRTDYPAFGARVAAVVAV
jgi:hypothetical protein